MIMIKSNILEERIMKEVHQDEPIQRKQQMLKKP